MRSNSDIFSLAGAFLYGGLSSLISSYIGHQGGKVKLGGVSNSHVLTQIGECLPDMGVRSRRPLRVAAMR